MKKVNLEKMVKENGIIKSFNKMDLIKNDIEVIEVKDITNTKINLKKEYQDCKNQNCQNCQVPWVIILCVIGAMAILVLR